MTTAVFVDSTTLLYTQDRNDPDKQARSTLWLKRLVASSTLVINLQVANETYAVVRRKPQFAHRRPAVRAFLQDLLMWATEPAANTALAEAWRLEDRYAIGFWDSMLLASANQAGCAVFLSEDLNDGQVYGAVRAINPFRHAPADVLGAAARP
ncbi:MAG TPA: PIN domain-containing protein [Caulobacteraceae bacterium]|jgi:predicted nucleic acid-binding protein